jgi:hypothetical protein
MIEEGCCEGKQMIVRLPCGDENREAVQRLGRRIVPRTHVTSSIHP